MQTVATSFSEASVTCPALPQPIVGVCLPQMPLTFHPGSSSLLPTTNTSVPGRKENLPSLILTTFLPVAEEGGDNG